MLNTKDFGIPQNRERVFLVATLRGHRRREVFRIGQNGGKVDEIIGDDLATYTITTRYNGAQSGGAYIAENREAVIRQIGNLRDQSGFSNPQAGRIYSADGISPTLNTACGGGHTPKFAIPVLTPDRAEKRQNGRRIKEDGEEMFTLTAQDRDGVIVSRGRGKYRGGVSEIAPILSKSSYEHNHQIYDGIRIRKLTPRECFRLQGFPDEYFDRARAVNSDAQLYKQAGNSVTVNVIEWIGKRLKEME